MAVFLESYSRPFQRRCGCVEWLYSWKVIAGLFSEDVGGPLFKEKFSLIHKHGHWFLQAVGAWAQRK
eukprot:c45574_g1_i1 orf=3-200(-)